MQKELKYIINQFKEDESSLNKIIVSVFVRANSIQVKNNTLIKSLLISGKSALHKTISEINAPLTFDDVIEAFGLAVLQILQPNVMILINITQMKQPYATGHFIPLVQILFLMVMIILHGLCL